MLQIDTKSMVEVYDKEIENIPSSNLTTNLICVQKLHTMEEGVEKPLPDSYRARKPSLSGDIKINVSFSGSKPIKSKERNENNDISDEENDNVRIQRQLFKQYKAADLHSNNILNIPKSAANSPARVNKPSDRKETLLRTINFESVDASASEFEPKLHEIIIQDFQFLISSITIAVGDSIEFKLSSSVPLHAEHIIYGISSINSLCFESPLLQVGEITSYEVEVKEEGEIFVSCRIFNDMECTIFVDSRHENRRIVPLSLSVSSSSFEHDESNGEEEDEEDTEDLLQEGKYTNVCMDDIYPMMQRAMHGMNSKYNTPSKQLSPMKETMTPAISGTIHHLIPSQPTSPNSHLSFSAVMDGKSSTMDTASSSYALPQKNSERLDYNRLYLYHDESDSFYDSDDIISILDELSSAAEEESRKRGILHGHEDDQHSNNNIPAVSGTTLLPLDQTITENVFEEEDDCVKEQILFSAPSSVYAPSSSSRSQQHHIVYANEFQFRPHSFQVHLGDSIQFQYDVSTSYPTTNSTSSTPYKASRNAGKPPRQRQDISTPPIYLGCEGEFENICLSSGPSQPTTTLSASSLAALYYQTSSFLYIFHSIGEYTVYNEIYPFITCTINVIHPTPVQSTSNSPTRSTNHAILPVTPPPKLFGSFAVPHSTPPPVFHIASSIPSSSILPSSIPAAANLQSFLYTNTLSSSSTSSTSSTSSSIVSTASTGKKHPRSEEEDDEEVVEVEVENANGNHAVEEDGMYYEDTICINIHDSNSFHSPISGNESNDEENQEEEHEVEEEEEAVYDDITRHITDIPYSLPPSVVNSVQSSPVRKSTFASMMHLPLTTTTTTTTFPIATSTTTTLPFLSNVTTTTTVSPHIPTNTISLDGFRSYTTAATTTTSATTFIPHSTITSLPFISSSVTSATPTTTPLTMHGVPTNTPTTSSNDEMVRLLQSDGLALDDIARLCHQLATLDNISERGGLNSSANSVVDTRHLSDKEVVEESEDEEEDDEENVGTATLQEQSMLGASFGIITPSNAQKNAKQRKKAKQRKVRKAKLKAAKTAMKENDNDLRLSPVIQDALNTLSTLTAAAIATDSLLPESSVELMRSPEKQREQYQLASVDYSIEFDDDENDDEEDAAAEGNSIIKQGEREEEREEEELKEEYVVLCQECVPSHPQSVRASKGPNFDDGLLEVSEESLQLVVDYFYALADESLEELEDIESNDGNEEGIVHEEDEMEDEVHGEELLVSLKNSSTHFDDGSTAERNLSTSASVTEEDIKLSSILAAANQRMKESHTKLQQPNEAITVSRESIQPSVPTEPDKGGNKRQLLFNLLQIAPTASTGNSSSSVPLMQNHGQSVVGIVDEVGEEFETESEEEEEEEEYFDEEDEYEDEKEEKEDEIVDDDDDEPATVHTKGKEIEVNYDEEFDTIMEQRMDKMIAKYQQNLKDKLPSGKSVPVLSWRHLPSSLPPSSSITTKPVSSLVSTPFTIPPLPLPSLQPHPSTSNIFFVPGMIPSFPPMHAFPPPPPLIPTATLMHTPRQDPTDYLDGNMLMVLRSDMVKEEKVMEKQAEEGGCCERKETKAEELTERCKEIESLPQIHQQIHQLVAATPRQPPAVVSSVMSIPALPSPQLTKEVAATMIATAERKEEQVKEVAVVVPAPPATPESSNKKAKNIRTPLTNTNTRKQISQPRDIDIEEEKQQLPPQPQQQPQPQPLSESKAKDKVQQQKVPSNKQYAPQQQQQQHQQQKLPKPYLTPEKKKDSTTAEMPATSLATGDGVAVAAETMSTTPVTPVTPKKWKPLPKKSTPTANTKRSSSIREDSDMPVEKKGADVAKTTTSSNTSSTNTSATATPSTPPVKHKAHYQQLSPHTTTTTAGQHGYKNIVDNKAPATPPRAALSQPHQPPLSTPPRTTAPTSTQTTPSTTTNNNTPNTNVDTPGAKKKKRYYQSTQKP